MYECATASAWVLLQPQTHKLTHYSLTNSQIASNRLAAAVQNYQKGSHALQFGECFKQTFPKHITRLRVPISSCSRSLSKNSALSMCSSRIWKQTTMLKLERLHTLQHAPVQGDRRRVATQRLSLLDHLGKKQVQQAIRRAHKGVLASRSTYPILVQQGRLPAARARVA